MSVLNWDAACWMVQTAACPYTDCLYVGLPRLQEPGSSGSVVFDYGLDDRAIGARSSAGAKDFSSKLCVQTGSGAYPASCTITIRRPFPGSKARRERDADQSTPSSAEVVNE
jgi:hypothetical protein